MRTQPRAFAGTAAALIAAAIVLAMGTGSVAAPGGQNRGTGGFPGDPIEVKDKDNRKGRAAPTAGQTARADEVDARARWNEFGTPAMLTSTGAPLAEGLPADPVAAAQAYVATNRELLGLTERAAKALEVISVAPMGDGAAVLFRQRFGNLEAGRDGVLAVGVRDGDVWHVSSSLARDASQPAAATLSANEAARIATADAGVDAAAVEGVELVALPVPQSAARAAYKVLLIGGDEAGPVGFTTYVDARDGSVLVREDLVDYSEDNPAWEVFPNTPPFDYSSTDTRVRWCFLPGPGCAEVVGTPASPLAWDVKASNEESTETTSGNNSFAVHNWFSNDPFKVGKELATPSPNREYTYAWTNQWLREKCSPAVFETGPRNDIDAARANLFAMHNRMHDWSYHLGFTESAWNLQEFNFGRGGDDLILRQRRGQCPQGDECSPEQE